MNVLQKVSMATIAGWREFRRVYADPMREITGTQFHAMAGQYDLRWAYYTNSAFEDLARWQPYRAQYRLYRNHRSIYNPTQRQVDWYAGLVYPGTVTASPDAEQGVQLAIPLAKDIDPALRGALGQLWQWSNWQLGNSRMVRYGGALGDVLVEAVDDLERRKVYMEVTWPGLVADLDLNPQGDVKSYAIQYDVQDDDGKSWTYRKEVDNRFFTYYRDKEITAQNPNPYGFTPAVWCKHTDHGGDHGSPAVRGLGKIDELNDLASMAHVNLKKLMSAPVVIATDGNVSNLDNSQIAKRGETDSADAETLNVLRAGPNTKMVNVTMSTEDVLPYIDHLITEIESDHPELTFYQKLREMTQVTGPAAEILMGDVRARLVEAQASYDQQCVKIFQMSIAMAGWRLATGDWQRLNGGPLTRQQQAFKGFDLDSYSRGDLDFTIMPRPLIPQTVIELLEIEAKQLDLERQKTALKADKQAMNEANLPGAIAQRLAGAGA